MDGVFVVLAEWLLHVSVDGLLKRRRGAVCCDGTGTGLLMATRRQAGRGIRRWGRSLGRQAAGWREAVI